MERVSDGERRAPYTCGRSSLLLSAVADGVDSVRCGCDDEVPIGGDCYGSMQLGGVVDPASIACAVGIRCGLA
jgi:hypothetical protein